MNVSVNSSPSTATPSTQQESRPTPGTEPAVREAVETARREVAEGIQGEREAFKLASDVNKKLSQARGKVKSLESMLARGDHLAPEERAALSQELESAKQEEATAQAEAEACEKYVVDWQGWRKGAEERLERAQNEGNKLLKSLGKPEEFKFPKPVHDLFLTQGSPVMRELYRLLGRSRSLPPQQGGSLAARRISASTRANSPNGAQLLAQLLEDNDDPAYRQTLVADSAGALMEMGSDLTQLLAMEGDQEALAEEMTFVMLYSLSRAGQKLGPGGTLPLAEAFARGFGAAQPNGRLAKRIAELLAKGAPDLTFAVELAASLYAGGNGAAADEVSGALADGLAKARLAFVRAAGEAEPLDASFVQKMPSYAEGRKPSELDADLKAFEKQHAAAFEAREIAAAALGNLLNGAALSLAISRTGGLCRNDTTARLLQEAMLSLGLTDRVLHTDRGQTLLGRILDMQAAGERTFLDLLPDVATALAAHQEEVPELLSSAGLPPDHYARGAASFRFGLQRAFARLLVPHLLLLRGMNRRNESVGLLWISITQNAGLFGLETPAAEALCRILAAVGHADQPFDLRRALGALQRFPVREDSGLAVLKAFGMVLGLTHLLVTVPSQQKPITDLLRTYARGLVLGPWGLHALCCLFAPLRATPDVTKLLGLGAGEDPSRMFRWYYGSLMEGLGGVLRMLVGPMDPPPASFFWPLPPIPMIPYALAEMLPIAGGNPLRVEALLVDFLRGLDRMRASTQSHFRAAVAA